MARSVNTNCSKDSRGVLPDIPNCCKDIRDHFQAALKQSGYQGTNNPATVRHLATTRCRIRVRCNTCFSSRAQGFSEV